MEIFLPGLPGSQTTVTQISVNRAENFPCNRKPSFYRFHANSGILFRKTQLAQPGHPVSCNRGLKDALEIIQIVIEIIYYAITNSICSEPPKVYTEKIFA